jgi:hypothetical protein
MMDYQQSNNDLASLIEEVQYLEKLVGQSQQIVELVDQVGSSIYESDGPLLLDNIQQLYSTITFLLETVTTSNEKDNNARTKESNTKFLSLLAKKAHEGYEAAEQLIKNRK